MSPSRVPRLALVAWAIAIVIIAGLGVAVANYLSAGMGHMHGSTADALTRGGAAAHGDLREPLHSVLFTAWQLDATALAVLVVLAALYLTATALVPMRTGERWPVRNTVFFLLGLAVAGFATNGSIAVYDQVLFSAHMLGHLALVMVAPALLMFGRPLRLLVTASAPHRSARYRRALTGRVASVLFAPPVALAVYTVVIVGSHLTGLMDAIMRNTWAGQVEHVVYLVAGCQYFALIVGDEPIRWRLGSPARWLLLALAMAVDTFTGIVLMQQTTAIELVPAGFGVDALSDTRTGGAIMWFAGDGIMAVIMVALVIDWLRNVESAAPDKGWLEQARVATFSSHTGSGSGAADDDASRDIDSDVDAHEAYNQWLARLDK